MSAGQVVARAINFDDARPNVDSWTQAGDAMVLDPSDNGDVWLPAGTGPRLSYRVNVTETGEFYLHVHATTGPNNGSDSLFAGMDGVPLPAEYDYDSAATQWRTGLFDVNTTGLHTLDIWGREDGITVRKLVLNRSPSAPQGNGPGESLRL